MDPWIIEQVFSWPVNDLKNLDAEWSDLINVVLLKYGNLSKMCPKSTRSQTLIKRLFRVNLDIEWFETWFIRLIEINGHGGRCKIKEDDDVLSRFKVKCPTAFSLNESKCFARLVFFFFFQKKKFRQVMDFSTMSWFIVLRS